MRPEDVDRLNQFRHVKVTLLFTFSGIDNKDIEPYPSSVAAILEAHECAGASEVPHDLVLASIGGWPERLRRALGEAYQLAQHADYLQHALGFQVHDVRHPHRQRRHGRADIGWKGREPR